MSDAASWSLGRKAMIGSLIIAHIWGTLLIVAVLQGRDTAVIGSIFDAVAFSIFTTLGILVGGKGWKEFAAMRYGGNRTEETTIVQTTVKEPTTDAQPPVSP